MTMDFYHKTVCMLSANEVDITPEHRIFAVFIRDYRIFYTPPDPFKLYEEIIEFAKENKLDINVSVLGLTFNKGLLPVTSMIPIVYVMSKTMDAIQLESFLINKVQLDLIYTTRLLEIKRVTNMYFPNAKLLEFGLRRGPSIQAANRFSEIAVSLGYYTSNLNIPLRGLIKGTLPHAFIQDHIFSKGPSNENEALQYEIQIWKNLILNRSINVILPDTINYYKLLDELLKDKNIQKFVGINKLIIRIDTTDKLATLEKIDAIAEKYRLKPHILYILSGDLDSESIRKLGESLNEFTRKRIIGIAIGTQVINNLKPLSIVYKLVQRGKFPVYKLSPGKVQLSGYHLVKYENNEPQLIKHDKFKLYDHGIYPVI